MRTDRNYLAPEKKKKHGTQGRCTRVTSLCAAIFLALSNFCQFLSVTVYTPLINCAWWEGGGVCAKKRSSVCEHAASFRQATCRAATTPGKIQECWKVMKFKDAVVHGDSCAFWWKASGTAHQKKTSSPEKFISGSFRKVRPTKMVPGLPVWQGSLKCHLSECFNTSFLTEQNF